MLAPAAAFIGMPELTPHDLRYSASGQAVQAGANVTAVQRMPGHTSAATGLFNDDLDAVAARLVRTMCGLRPLRTTF
ncbi:MAG TPA: hypothetical protein VFP51_14880 [Nocardioidaceae bacterium]|nr:hypothetical protein [Nocardioidaceae bacterium]